ncbi:MAG: hypothetical protein ACR2GQ_02850 [Gemmatimonadota bacterium]
MPPYLELVKVIFWPPRLRSRCLALSFVGLLALAACGAPSDGGSDAARDAEGIEAESPHPRAGYLTSLTFVGFEATPALAHFRFENLADRNRLALSYAGWIGGGSSWTSLLDARDTLTVARAAWRVVPVRPLRLGVGAGAQIDWLRLPVGESPLRLQALDAITSWSSATGQREALRSAELTLGPGTEAGLLLQRREARPLDIERPGTPSQVFLVTDTLGNGLIVMRNRALPDVPASVWAWLDGERLEWTDVLVIALTAPAGSPGRWSLEIPREGLVVEIEGSAPLVEAASGSGAATRLFPVVATLSVGEVRRAMSGISVEDDGP